MAEDPEPPSSVRVRDLIWVFESKTNESVRVEYSRPRAKSLGNILSKNVVVKTNEVTTLEGVEKALDDFKESLSQYNVYNKQKHVELQNQLFNILTSIGNVRSDIEADITRKHTLTTSTLGLVSSLNQILPSNNSLNELNVDENVSNDRIHKKNEKRENEYNGGIEHVSNQRLHAFEPSISDESVVSVKKLRERFQSNNGPSYFRHENVTKSNREEEYRTEFSLTLKQVSMDNREDTIDSALDVKNSEKKEKEKDVSVSKLKILYEKKTEETSRGLQVILNEEDSQHHRFRYKVDIPYLEIQNKENLTGISKGRHTDFDRDDQSLTDSSYITTYNSMNGSDGEQISETDSETGSSRSADSVREIQFQ